MSEPNDGGDSEELERNAPVSLVGEGGLRPASQRLRPSDQQGPAFHTDL